MAHRRIRPFARLQSWTTFTEAAPPAAEGHAWSIDLDGTTEYLRKFTTTVKVGYDNHFTWIFWIKPDIQGIQDMIFEVEGSAGDWNGCKIYSYTPGTGGENARVSLSQNGGTTRKMYDYTGLFTTDVWQCIGVTWDGTNNIFRVYSNGAWVEPTTITQDLTSPQVDNVSKITVGTDGGTSQKAKGIYHQVACWDEPLTDEEMLAVYNQGAGSTFDYRENSGDYASSANLIRLFWLGDLGPSVGDAGTWGMDKIDEDFDLFESAPNVDSADIVTDVPETAFTPHTDSVSFDGLSERLLTDATVKVGIANAWTVAQWHRPGGRASNDAFLDIRHGSHNGNRITLLHAGASPNYHDLRVNLYNSAGTQQKNWLVSGVLANWTWTLIGLTWDGTTLAVYKDGVLQSGNILKTTDNAMTMTDETYQIAVGSDYFGTQESEGLNHSLMIWDEELTSGEMLGLYHGGDGVNFDMQKNKGTYASPGNLVRWFQVGKDSADIGKETVSGDVDLMDNQINITSADIVADAPRYSSHGWSLHADNSLGMRTSQTTSKFFESGSENFTISWWWWPDIVSSNDYVFDWTNVTTSQNRVAVYSQGVTYMRVFLSDTAGTNFKQYNDTDGFVDNQWQLHTLTWDGTNLLVYRDGVELTMTKTIDSAGSQSDSRYKMSVGATVGGSAASTARYHSFMIWDEVLTSGEILATYNGGEGNNIDYRKNFGNYTSAPNLRRYFRLGNGGPVLGSDSTWGLDLISGGVDLMANDIGAVGAGDIEDYSPQSYG